MYKLLLCWRYLKTRWLAMVCVVSVMLGVATLIVVNSVMSGFSTKLKDRLHGLLSDVVVESLSHEGFSDPQEKVRRIMESPAGRHISAVSPTVEVFAILQWKHKQSGETIVRPVRIIGIEPESRARIGGFAEHLVEQKGAEKPSFDLAGEALRRYERNHPDPAQQVAPLQPVNEDGVPPPDPVPTEIKVPRGLIVGNAIASYRLPTKKGSDKPQDVFLLEPGDDVFVLTSNSHLGRDGRITPVFDRFVVRDYFKSEMSEYDANFVFVPLDYLQHIRTMEGRVNQLQIRLKDYEKSKEVCEELATLFPHHLYSVQTWEQKQGPLLAAIDIERGILNVILFLIILVAGFGILSIFSMIVYEKTRDIGILKSLGASDVGVLSIFMGYGLLLGVVGAVLGTALGLGITFNINEIEKVISWLTGSAVFARDIYYFDKIPTNVQPFSVGVVNVGAVTVAVVFSILPALRAALLHPVRALRYE